MDQLIEDIVKLNRVELSTCLLKLNKELKKIVLKNDKVRNKLIESRNHTCFIDIIKHLEDEEISFLIDKEMIERILNYEYKNEKIETIITLNSSYSNKVLSNEKVFDFITESNIHFSICCFNSKLGQDFFDYLCNKNNKLFLLGKLNSNVQLEIFNNKDNISKLEQIENVNILPYLNVKTIECLLKYPKYNIEFINLDIKDINRIVKEGLIIPPYVSNSTIFINKYLNISNINIYRIYINNLNMNNSYLVQIIEKKRNIQYDEQYNDINQKGVFNSLINDDIPLFKDFLGEKNNKNFKEYTDKKSLEILIDKYFKDITYNFLKNTIIILDYISKNKDLFIPKERLEIYENIVKFYKLSIEERKKLYFSLNNIQGLIENYYEDYSLCKKHSIELLNSKLIRLNDIEKNKKLSSKYNIPIYELAGQDFYAIVNHTNYPKAGSNDIVWQNDYETASLSVISNNHINTIKDAYENVILGFNRIDSKRVIHISNSDAGTSYLNGTDLIQKIYTPEDLIKNTEIYNEILYQEINNQDLNNCVSQFDTNHFKPDYVLCYDRIDKGDIECARKLKVPIIVLHSKEYKNNRNHFQVVDRYKYQEYEFKLINNYKK